MKIASHTIVKQGMPFLPRVLNQVAPYMDKMFITVSQNSTDGTLKAVEEFILNHPKTLVEFGLEGESNPGNLTKVRQFQVSRTAQDWILFLDDDDYWPEDQLVACLQELDKNKDVLAYSVNPYQVLSPSTHDANWHTKSFSKFLRNVAGLHYRGDWPRDMPSDADGKWLYWKTHPKVKTLPYRFYHLSAIKSGSFRYEAWAQKFKMGTPKPQQFSVAERLAIEWIKEYI